jgi:hypothetical protein
LALTVIFAQKIYGQEYCSVVVREFFLEKKEKKLANFSPFLERGFLSEFIFVVDKYRKICPCLCAEKTIEAGS